MLQGEILEKIKRVYRSCTSHEQLLIAQKYARMLINKKGTWGLVEQAIYYDAFVEVWEKINKRIEMAELAMPMPL
jgi:hypothetical protein